MSEHDVASREARAVSNGRHAWAHVRAEYVDDNVDGIVATLKDEGPYAYTLVPTLDAAGNLVQRIERTREGIRAAYVQIDAATKVFQWRALTELREDWYVFHQGISDFLDKVADTRMRAEISVLFPNLGTDVGITGELFMVRNAYPYDDQPAPRVLEADRALDVLARHDDLVAAFAADDPDAVAALMAGPVQTAVRDYVVDDGTLTELHDREQLRAHYAELAACRSVVSVELLRRVVDDAFAFAELLWTVDVSAGPRAGTRACYRTAEMHRYDCDGRVDVRIGHGTELFS